MTIIKGVCCINEKNIKGTIIFEENLKDKNVNITINIKGLKEGKHGFHIHEYGDLREGCNSLCAHFNPHNTKHGDISDNKKNRHIGDLGNIYSNKNKICIETKVDKLIKLRGKYSIIGRSVVIHEDEDDLGKGNNKESKITGNAGKRIACGIIGYAK